MFRQYEEEQSRIQKSDAQQKNHKAEAELFAPTGTASLKSANRGLSASTEAPLGPAVNSLHSPNARKARLAASGGSHSEIAIMSGLALDVGNIDVKSESITYVNEIITCRYAMPAQFSDRCAGRQP